MPFVPTRTLGGGAFEVQRFKVSSSAALYIGDPTRVSAGLVKPMGTAVSALGLVGVVAALYDENQKPLTFSQPTRGPYKPAATSGYADVYVGTDIVYAVTGKGTTTLASAIALIGTVRGVSAGTPNTAAGKGGYVLTTAAFTTAGEGAFKVLGPAQVDAYETFATGSRLEVVIARNGAGVA